MRPCAFLRGFLLLLIAPLLSDAQSATCTNWTFFNGFSPSGINRWGTVVGSGQQSTGVIAGYIRYSNGATKTYIAPNAAPPTNWTFLTKRNKYGVTVGWFRDANQNAHGLLLSGSSTTTVDYPGSIETILYGINNWGSMVGIWGLGDFSQPYDGFKMWKNGGVVTIHYPGAMMTNPAAISDTGIIVGNYVKAGAQPPFPYHGFILVNGAYKTVDFPKSNRTFLTDINAAGVIVGTRGNPSTGGSGGFIYVNGTFKDVKGPNVQVSSVDGINGFGDVTGTSSGGSFTAHCQ